MEIEDRSGREWMVCPNGCATEYEAPRLKSPGMEITTAAPDVLAKVQGAGS